MFLVHVFSSCTCVILWLFVTGAFCMYFVEPCGQNLRPTVFALLVRHLQNKWQFSFPSLCFLWLFEQKDEFCLTWRVFLKQRMIYIYITCPNYESFIWQKPQCLPLFSKFLKAQFTYTPFFFSKKFKWIGKTWELHTTCSINYNP